MGHDRVVRALRERPDLLYDSTGRSSGGEDREEPDRLGVDHVGIEAGEIAVPLAERLEVGGDQRGRLDALGHLQPTEVLARITDAGPFPVDGDDRAGGVDEDVRGLEISVDEGERCWGRPVLLEPARHEADERVSLGVRGLCSPPFGDLRVNVGIPALWSHDRVGEHRAVDGVDPRCQPAQRVRERGTRIRGPHRSREERFSLEVLQHDRRRSELIAVEVAVERLGHRRVRVACECVE
jgi:hypothetical protein